MEVNNDSISTIRINALVKKKQRRVINPRISNAQKSRSVYGMHIVLKEIKENIFEEKKTM